MPEHETYSIKVVDYWALFDVLEPIIKEKQNEGWTADEINSYLSGVKKFANKELENAKYNGIHI